MHITKKLAAAHAEGRPTYSFEYFPPKTAQGVQNLYDRMDRMHGLGPAFIDVTWGAGGRMSSLTTEMVKVAQSAYGLETCMHLTCTDMEKEKIDGGLREAYQAGCTNILALRGDPPREKEKWEQTEGTAFRYARDLIKYIKAQYGNHFDIGVAGYPEGCDAETDADGHIPFLKEKIDAGGSFIVTQMSYDAEIFIEWAKKVRAAGVPESVPIIPGIMPIQTYDSFLRRANWTQCRIPPQWMEALEPIKADDAAVREVGKKLVGDFCRKLLDSGVTMHLHFYTMNLEKSTYMVLEDLAVTPPSDHHDPELKPLPWRPSLGLNRRDENVRPIFWRNRNRSYVMRTQDWDEFPNGRWGDSRSPAFGALDAYSIGLKGTNEQNRKLWGEPTTVQEVAELFVKYMSGKVETLPWSEQPISPESNVLTNDLVNLNSRGLLTINSQPAVDGMKSSHPVYGWGPNNGYVYQKAYLEVLISPSLITELIRRMDANADITYYAVNNSGELKTNAPQDGGPNAVTWGVFPGKEIVQPTIVETISFLAWRDEFYHLGSEWAKCYDEGSRSKNLIKEITESWYLVNIVDNDFRNERGIFPLFDGLKVEGVEPTAAAVNGVAPHVNGDAQHGDVEKKQGAQKPEVNGVPDKNNAVNHADGPAVNGQVKN
ncbi:methylenetetrahydrofolate reductase 2 [Hortaea werneckii]|nr:methylenetetrahydrofolate reductase 2 [Hortaea werneckii]KAI6987176.1 methylenetetrahydrofolate reductase 2 [Hortaea werneckii]KAI7141289.1 methylenetetrahydrofolate reductase 2 [Hortaea werneckii]KAI7168009.1 methylenetetrahydrofolate reductase 2 [Hortaea werneckii]KAI7510351.1 methylenetetrahydrofolate reductase 2 [Hortaea werneckii]